jgi:hypothetical protein
MKQLVLNIPEDKYPFFMELIRSLGFVKVSVDSKLTKEQQAFVDGTKQAYWQVDKHLNGEIELKTAEQLIDEL